ncbi:MAG: esterase family protein [Alicyclobacillus sp.]|nr:esterase family protein [Alicyclobacillus sp.]
MSEYPATDARYAKRVIEAHTVQSAHLGEERTIKVCLPAGYDPSATRPYPVLYCHDGLEFFTHGRIATIANQMAEQGRLDPLVIVGMAVNKQTRNEDYDPSGSRHAAYVRFVLEECVPLIEGRYRVRTDTDGRWMAGISLGGSAALSIHLSHPQAFRRLLLFSGAFYPFITEEVRRQTTLSNLQAYQLVGRQETEVETATGTYDFCEANRTMHRLLVERGARITWKESDGTHIWGFWQRELPEALAYLQSLVGRA